MTTEKDRQLAVEGEEAATAIHPLLRDGAKEIATEAFYHGARGGHVTELYSLAKRSTLRAVLSASSLKSASDASAKRPPASPVAPGGDDERELDPSRVSIDPYRQMLADQAEAIDMERFAKLLARMSVAAPEGGIEHLTAHFGEMVNALSLSVIFTPSQTAISTYAVGRNRLDRLRDEDAELLNALGQRTAIMIKDHALPYMNVPDEHNMHNEWLCIRFNDSAHVKRLWDAIRRWESACKDALEKEQFPVAAEPVVAGQDDAGRR